MSKTSTPLEALHLDAGARMVDFAGWSMPLQYTSIAEEHHAVRNKCGTFDISHMGRFSVHGETATTFLDAILTRPIASMTIGQVRYALVCNEHGGIEDDVLVSREDHHRYHVVVNASNRAKLWQLWTSMQDTPHLDDLTDSQAMIALQGPSAQAIATQLGVSIPDNLGHYRFTDTTWNGSPLRVSRTGYTGENGYELLCSPNMVTDLWRSLTQAGAAPCGLGARDTLRLEAGMPLYGHELDSEHSPIEAGLAFAVGKQKAFRGSTVLHRQLTEGADRKLIGLRCPTGRPPRQDYAVLNDAGQPIGSVTSGAPSPTLGIGIAIAYVETAHAIPGNKLAVDIRGRATTEAEVVELPFYRRAY